MNGTRDRFAADREHLVPSTLVRHSSLLLAGSIASALAGGCNLVHPLGGYKAEDELIQQVTAQGSATRSLEVTLPDATHGDALILVTASVENPPSSVSGGGVTWSEQAKSMNHVAVAVWVGFGTPLNSSTPVTVTWAATQTRALVQLGEWQGPTGRGSAVVNSGNGDPISTSSLTVDDNTVLVLAAAAAHGMPAGDPTKGLTKLADVSLGDTQLVAAYEDVPGAGSASTTWTYVSTQSWDSILVSYTK